MYAMSAMRQYQQVNTQAQVHDASPHRLIQLLMEGGLQRIAQAKGALMRGQASEKGIFISKALGIVGGLHEAIDTEKGGEYAERLGSLYGYIARRLVDANIQSDADALDEAARLLRTVKEGWDAIAPVA